MTKTVIAALLMALALTACHKGNNPSDSSSGGSSAPAGLQSLGGNSRK
jgi:hypothetical protein